MEAGKDFISRCFGGTRVIYCHNPTAMSHDEDMIGYFHDLTQAGRQKYMGYITDEVTSLVQHLKQAIQQVGKNGRVVHIAHSQGALITALAAEQLTPLEMSQMEILAFGGAAVLRRTPQTPFLRCVNYYSVNDPLLFVVPQAAQALRSGFAYTSSAGSITTAATASEFCFLAPRCGDPIEDHNLFNPTYLQALEWEGARYQRLYINPVRRTVYWVIQTLLALVTLLRQLVRQVHEQIQAIIKLVVVRPILIWCTLVYLSTVERAQQLQAIVKNVLVRPFLVWCAWTYLWTLKGVQQIEERLVLPIQRLLLILIELIRTTFRRDESDETQMKTSRLPWKK